MRNGKLTLIRHFNSYYNDRSEFAGNLNIPLSKKGIESSLKFSKIQYCDFDFVFTSELDRALSSATILLSKFDLHKVPIIVNKFHEKKFPLDKFLPIIRYKELNERSYGIIQSKNFFEVAEQYGYEKLHKWRRSFNNAPPQGESFKKIYKRISNIFKYKWKKLFKTKNILIVAHQNSIRALVSIIFKLPEKLIKLLDYQNGETQTIEYYDGIPIVKGPKPCFIIMAAVKAPA